jgi:hypothetical protein
MPFTVHKFLVHSLFTLDVEYLFNQPSSCRSSFPLLHNHDLRPRNLIRIFSIKISYKLERPSLNQLDQLDLAGEQILIVAPSETTQKTS